MDNYAGPVEIFDADGSFVGRADADLWKGTDTWGGDLEPLFSRSWPPPEGALVTLRILGSGEGQAFVGVDGEATGSGPPPF
ncbi:MAG: hypothetical protein ACE5KX_02695 [Acidimicrobiia bacterium]